MPLDEEDEHDELLPPTPLLLLPLPDEPNPLDNCEVDPLLLLHPWLAGRVGTAPVLFTPSQNVKNKRRQTNYGGMEQSARGETVE